ncbi:MAG: hypothetical protein ABI051_10690 [Vicinamibacterales bacterium]
MSMAAVRCAVLGAGRIGQIHAANVAHHVAGATLAAYVDVRREVADGWVTGSARHTCLRTTGRLSTTIPPPESFIATSGGLFLDMTVHDLDMVRFVTGREVRAVSA